MRKMMIFCWLFAVLMACNKDTVETISLASLKIVNVVAGGESVKMGGLPNAINSNSNVNFALLPGTREIYVYPESDSLSPWFISEKELIIEENKGYSLFLGGTPSNVVSLFLEDKIPVRTDSSAGIRFIHLSSDAPAVNITLSSSPEVNVFEDVAYRNITEFRAFPAKVENKSYTFQVRDAVTSEVIASLTMSGTSVANFVPRFKNVTLVLRGLVSGSPAVGITRVNHY